MVHFGRSEYGELCRGVYRVSFTAGLPHHLRQGGVTLLRNPAGNTYTYTYTYIYIYIMKDVCILSMCTKAYGSFIE